MVMSQVRMCGFQGTRTAIKATTQATKVPTTAPTKEDKEMSLDFFATPKYVKPQSVNSIQEVKTLTPMKQETALPPLNFKKMDQQWPTAANKAEPQ